MLVRSRRLLHLLLILAATAAALASGLARELEAQATTPSPRASTDSTFRLTPCRLDDVPGPARCGTYWVHENRATRTGRTIPLNVVVLPAKAATPAPDPVFSLYGGPGQTATEYAAQEWEAWYRDEREVVLVDQRGTGGPTPLNCRLSGSPENIQGYFEPQFQPALFRACRAELEKVADLRLYTTPIAMDDLDEVRQALGYDRINLVGGSYGSRAALVYIRQHGDRVRSAALLALNPFSFKNPLFHAKSAQRALDSLLAACDRQESCHTAFPNIRAEFATVLERLSAKPARVSMRLSEDASPVEVAIGRQEFAEALRVMTYTPERAQSVPLVLHRAFLGDLKPFAAQGFASNYGLRSILRYGMLMSTTCSEDVARITEAEIVRETKGTYLGDARVRQQIAACREWPAAPVPADYATPFTSQVPALLVTGKYDPATPPGFGDEMKRVFLPNSLHLVIDRAGHSARSECTDAIAHEFMRRASVAGLDTSCVSSVKLAPFLTAEPALSRGQSS